MSQICLYFDEDAGKLSLVQALRSSSVDIITTSEANNLGRPDEEQLIWATEQGRVIYSFNMGDFCRLHSIVIGQNLTHAGILVVPKQSYSIGEQLRGILNLIATKSAEEMINQLEFLGAYIRGE